MDASVKQLQTMWSINHTILQVLVIIHNNRTEHLIGMDTKRMYVVHLASKKGYRIGSLARRGKRRVLFHQHVTDIESGLKLIAQRCHGRIHKVKVPHQVRKIDGEPIQVSELEELLQLKPCQIPAASIDIPVMVPTNLADFDLLELE